MERIRFHRFRRDYLEDELAVAVMDSQEMGMKLSGFVSESCGKRRKHLHEECQGWKKWDPTTLELVVIMWVRVDLIAKVGGSVLCMEILNYKRRASWEM